MRVPKKTIAIVALIIAGITLFSVILFTPHSSLVPREHAQAEVLLFSKNKESSLITSKPQMYS